MTTGIDDPYDWAQKKIIQLIKKYESMNIHDDKIYTINHGIWSLKKLIALNCYSQKFIEILKSNDFNECIFVDPFCGSGLIEIQTSHPFPGSALVSLFTENKSFDRYYFSDIDQVRIKSLETKLSNLRDTYNINISNSNFKDRINEIFSGHHPKSQQWKDRGYLVFLDPYGFDITWDSMNRILRSGPVDLIITMMTSSIKWNASIDQSKNKLKKLFGDDEWQSRKNDLLEYYCEKIHQYGYNKKYSTKTIEVKMDTGAYHIIFASQSSGGMNVFDYVKERIDKIDLSMLTHAYEVIGGKATSITDYIDQ